MITPELETVEDPNIFYIESVTIEHPETNTKLSRSIENPNIITQQQQKKTKVSTEVKSADHILQLYIIKKHILHKKCLQHFEMKTLNSKKHNEQLKLMKYSIKNKFIEITKEFE